MHIYFGIKDVIGCSTHPFAFGQILSTTVNCLWALSQMNLTSPSAHAYRGVRPVGVVETELELKKQRVVTLVVLSTKVKLYALRVAAGPVSFVLATKFWMWKSAGKLQELSVCDWARSSAGGW